MWPHKHKESYRPETRVKSRQGAGSDCQCLPYKNNPFLQSPPPLLCFLHGLRCCIANCEELISTMPSSSCGILFIYLFLPPPARWEVTSSLMIQMWLIHLSGTTPRGLMYGTSPADNGWPLEHKGQFSPRKKKTHCLNVLKKSRHCEGWHIV